MVRRHPIGLGQAAKLCGMSMATRCAFLAEGLPVILDSAEGFWSGSQALKDHPREADVLEGFACEEAAKVLILVDMMRCPRRERDRHVGKAVRWFYDHLARLLYTEVVGWRPITKADLRDYVDRHRRSHEVDGPVGEYILPAGPVHEREQRLYADIMAYEEGEPMWNTPSSWRAGTSFTSLGRAPDVLRLVQSMKRLGLFTADGLAATADVWGREELTDAMVHYQRVTVTQALLLRVQDKGLIQEDASDEDVDCLYRNWPFPMWDFDLRLIEVPLEDLEAERDENLWWEMN